MIRFTQKQINTFDAEERELFLTLANKVGAKIEPEENGAFDIRSYLQLKAKEEGELAKWREELEKSFVTS